MTETLVNFRHLGEYMRIFGHDKMLRLWHEFLETSAAAWENIETKEMQTRRLTFHSWKSSSQVFGMDTFSHHCALIEENILSRHHWDKLAEMIAQSHICYQDSIKEVSAYFAQMEETQ